MSGFLKFFSSQAKNDESYTEAFLGNDDEMYYDEALKKWVVKGKEQINKPASPVPPPPPVVVPPPLQSMSQNAQPKIAWNHRNANFLYTNTPGICFKESSENNKPIYLTPSHLKQSKPPTGFNNSFGNGISTFATQEPQQKADVSFVIDNSSVDVDPNTPERCNRTDYLGPVESKCQLVSDNDPHGSDGTPIPLQSSVVSRDGASHSISRKSTVHRQLTVHSRTTSIAYGNDFSAEEVVDDEFENYIDHVVSTANDTDNSLFRVDPGDKLLLETLLFKLKNCVTLLESVNALNIFEDFSTVDESLGLRLVNENLDLIHFVQVVYRLLEDSLSNWVLLESIIENRILQVTDSNFDHFTALLNVYHGNLYALCYSNKEEFNSSNVDVSRIELQLNDLVVQRNKIIADIDLDRLPVDSSRYTFVNLEKDFESLKI